MEMTTVAGADMGVQCTNKACPGVVLENSKQDVPSRLGVACVDVVQRDGPLVRAQWEWQESGHGEAMHLIEVIVRRWEYRENMGAYRLLLVEAVGKKLLVKDQDDDTWQWQNRVWRDMEKKLR